MLRAQLNEHREFIDLCGFWEFRADGEDRGRASGWSGGFADGIPIAVPASWNDQLNHLRDFLGPAWYQTSFVLPPSWRGGRMLLRFGSVNYLAEVWLNDRSLGGHEGGHLPFGFDATAAVRPGRNLLVVRVDGELAPDRVPPGRVPPDPRDAFASSQFPDTSFDFFPFCGIQRPVNLCHVPAEGLEAIEVDTAIDGDAGIVRVRVRCAGPGGAVSAFGSRVMARRWSRTPGSIRNAPTSRYACLAPRSGPRDRRTSTRSRRCWNAAARPWIPSRSRSGYGR